jgi:glycosyltransferase involved in cell wall biosynthesis
MSLYIDLSEFLVNPIRTGIQRISGEICRYLPPNTAVPVRVHEGGFVALAPELIGKIGTYFADGGTNTLEEIRRLGAASRGQPIQITTEDIMLVAEVFNNPLRLALFRSMAEQSLARCRFIVYDLLPLTHPEYFDRHGLSSIYEYFHLLRRAPHCGFISEYTRNTYYSRLKRAAAGDGVVLPLGSDALGGRPNRPGGTRPLSFSVLGTIEPRKNHALILDAFEPLLNEIEGLKLCFIGKMGWVDAAFAKRVEALSSDPNSGFHFISTPSDGAIRSYIESSRATIYVSAAEGFGLPPVESLWVGTPVIASPTIPSLERLGSRGIHYVQPLDVAQLRRAVVAFLDDEYANRKAEETSRLNLPTWRSFTEHVMEWCREPSREELRELIH